MQTLVRDKKTGKFVKLNEFDWALHSIQGTWTKQPKPAVKVKVKAPRNYWPLWVLACGLAAFIGMRLGSL